MSLTVEADRHVLLAQADMDVASDIVPPERSTLGGHDLSIAHVLMPAMQIECAPPLPRFLQKLNCGDILWDVSHCPLGSACACLARSRVLNTLTDHRCNTLMSPL